MTPQEIRLLSSEKIRAEIEYLKATAKLLEGPPTNGQKMHTARKISELEDVLFSRG